MANEVGFNENDFFYNNVNAPIKFDPAKCTLSDDQLKAEITKALNIPTDISAGQIPQIKQGQGQCTIRKFDPEKDDANSTANSWSMKYIYDDSGLQNCTCVKNDPSPQYITNSLLVTNSSLEGSALDTNKYVCTSSIPLQFKDSKINDIHLDQATQQQIISSSVQYYKAVCKNKELAAELLKTNSSNEDAEVKYNDVRTFYNREYLNRINLGAGILISCGLIYYTFSQGTTPEIILPTIPKPNI